MKIIHVVRRFSFENWGGIEEAVWNLSLEMVALGHEVEIHATAALSLEGIELKDGVKIVRHHYFYPYLFLSRKQKGVMDRKGGNPIVRELLNAVEGAQADVIHCHTMGRIREGLLQICQKLGVNLITTFHGGLNYISSNEEQNPVRLLPFNIGFGRMFKSFYQSIRIDEYRVLVSVEEFNGGLCKEKLYIPNGVSRVADYQFLDPKSYYNIDKKKKIILNISRIDGQKNQGVLVDLMGTLDSSLYHLIICGPITSEEYYEEIALKITQLGLEASVTIIPGLKPNSRELNSLFHIADLFLLPSVHEPFGIVVLEAWLRGIPVIGSNVGGVKDLILDQETGLLFDPEKHGSLEKAFSYFEKMNETEKREMIAKGKKLAEEVYSWNSVATDHIKAYQDFICKETKSIEMKRMIA